LDDPFDDPAGYKVVAGVDREALAGGNGRSDFREFNEEAVGRGKDDGRRSGVAVPDLGGDGKAGGKGERGRTINAAARGRGATFSGEDFLVRGKECTFAAQWFRDPGAMAIGNKENRECRANRQQ
jgi:hypothetical protein